MRISSRPSSILLLSKVITFFSASPLIAAPQKWQDMEISLKKDISASHPQSAAQKAIQIFQIFQKTTLTETDKDLRNFLLITVPDTMLALSNADDYNSAETLGKWNTSICEAKFGHTSPLTYMAYQLLGGYVYSQAFNRITPNKKQKDKENNEILAQIAKQQSKNQNTETKALEDASIKRSMPGALKELDDLQGKLKKTRETYQKMDSTLEKLKKAH